MENKAEKIKPYAGDERQKGDQVRDMFDNIAPAYDFMNRAMTLGIDTRWRKKAVRMIRKDAERTLKDAERGGDAPSPHRSAHRADGRTRPYRILDVATGTADLAIMMAREIPQALITGIDLSKEMVEIGRGKVAEAHLEGRVDFAIGDCLHLPMADNTYDCITAAFGVRNFERLAEGYREMLRVLRPGGMLCVIELSTPASPVVKPFYKLYTRHIIPIVGRMISKDTSAYAYLPASIEAVPARGQMTEIIADAGYTDARYVSLTFGVCTIYTAVKP